MAIYKKTNITAKEGINFVRSAVEAAGSIFHKIEQENDLGVDALVELMDKEEALHQQIALQIKAGNSYYDHHSSECQIPIGSHKNYWLKHPLPVFGIVYVPKLNCAYWVDIKSYLKAYPQASNIRFCINKINRFDVHGFNTLFLPLLINKVPNLPLQEAFVLFRSHITEEIEIGLTVLFHYYKDNTAVWDELIKFYLETPSENIPGELIYYLAHIPWHGDIYSIGPSISSETRSYGKGLLDKFGYDAILKLFDFIDSGISRGSLGQSVEAIISSIPNFQAILKKIIIQETSNSIAQDCSGLILAMHEDPDALPLLESMARLGSSYAQELIWHIQEYGEVNPYC